MTADFKMKFDDGGTPDGLKKVADAGDKTAESLKDVGQTGLKAAEGIAKTGDEASSAAGDVQKLESELTDVAGGAQKAESAVESFTISTDQMAKKMDAAADKAEHLARAQAKVAKGGHETGKGIDTAKDAFGGLDAILTTAGLPGLGSLAGGLERATMGFKDLSAAGGGQAAALTKILIPLAAVYATYKSLEVIFNSTLELMPEIRVKWDAITESVSGYIEQARKLANDYGFLDDEGEELKKSTEEMNKAFNEQQDALAKAQLQMQPTIDKIKALNDEMERGKEQEKIKVEIEGITNIESAEREIQSMQKALDDIANRPAPTVEAANQNAKELEALWKQYEPRIRALEDRRKQLQQQQKDEEDARKQAAANQKKDDEDTSTRRSDEHDAEMDRIKTESDARKKASDEVAKREADAAKQSRDARIEEILKTKESTDTKIEGIQQVQQAEQQAQPNKYGEGEAPTAGQDAGNNPYAAALDPFSQFTSDFNFAGNSYTETSMNPGSGSGGGSDKAATRKVIQEAVDEQLRQHEADFAKAMASKYDVEGDVSTVNEVIDAVNQTGRKVDFKDDVNQFNREQRGLKKTETQSYRKAMAGRDTGEDEDSQAGRQDELVDASMRLLDETKQTNQARKQMGKEQIDVTKELAQNQADDRAEIAAQKADLEAIKQIMRIGAQRAQAFRKGPAPSNRTSQVRANP